MENINDEVWMVLNDTEEPNENPGVGEMPEGTKDDEKLGSWVVDKAVDDIEGDWNIEDENGKLEETRNDDPKDSIAVPLRPNWLLVSFRSRRLLEIESTGAVEIPGLSWIVIMIVVAAATCVTIS